MKISTTYPAILLTNQIESDSILIKEEDNGEFYQRLFVLTPRLVSISMSFRDSVQSNPNLDQHAKLSLLC